MKIFHVTTLMIAAVVGCGQLDDSSINSVTVTDEPSEVVTMDPNDIFFTTPTLNDAIPETLAGSTVPSDSIQLHEDDWRQFEFIADKWKHEVDAELADIRVIWDKNSVPLGDSGTAFRAVHVRKRIQNPLQLQMALTDFEIFAGQKTGTMAFFGYDGVLRDVHAVRIDNLVMYALIQEGHVTTIGFDAVDQFTLPVEFIERLSKLIQDHDLILVHWRSRTLLETRKDIMAYFGARD